EEALALMQRRDLVGRPIDDDDKMSAWLTAAEPEQSAMRVAVGRSHYRAYAGSYTGGLNGAYWVEVLAHRTDGTLLVRNLNVGRIAVESVTTSIEPDLVFPLLRGRDVS